MQYRLWQPCRVETTQCNSLVNSSNRVLQVQVVDQTTHPPKCHSFVGLDRQIGSSPPANINRFPVKVTRQESRKFYICSDVTHTHKSPLRSREPHTRSVQSDLGDLGSRLPFVLPRGCHRLQCARGWLPPHILAY